MCVAWSLSSFLTLLATIKDLPSFLLSWETMALVHARFLLDVNIVMCWTCNSLGRLVMTTNYTGCFVYMRM